jgi:hypothetical protein
MPRVAIQLPEVEREDQVVRSLDGTVLGEGDVVHVYSFRGALIARMDVEDAEGRPDEH